MLTAVIVLSILVVVLSLALAYVFFKYIRKPEQKIDENKSDDRKIEEKKEPEEKSHIEKGNPDEENLQIPNPGDPFDAKKKEKGKIGEKLVDEALENLLKHEYGYLFTNFCFENENGFSSEIDALLICEGGIFVIETKNINGLICGKRESTIWNAFRPNPYEKPSEFHNPIYQNQRHIRNLGLLFSGNHPPKMISMVIFPTGDISRVGFPEVKTLPDGMDYIKKAIAAKKYSKEFVDRMYRQITVIKDDYGIDRKRHLENLLQYQQQNDETF